MGMRLLDKLELEDKVVAVFLALVLVFLLVNVADFKHIPGPIYGGDLYMIRGFTQSIIQGNSPLKDPFFENEYAYYGWLSYLITALLVKISWLGLEKMSIYLPVLVQLGYLGASYLFGSSFFKSKRYGIIFMLVAFAYRIIDTKISAGFAVIFVLLTLWSWIKYEQGSKKHSYMMGLFWGLTALTHINYFIGLSAIIGLTVAFEFLAKIKKGNKGKVLAGFIKKYLIVVGIALVLALVLVGPWLFVYHMNTLNPAQQYSMQDISKAGVGWVIGLVWGFFVRTNGVIPFVWGLILIFGLVFCVLNRKKIEQRYVLYWLVAGIAGASHHLITKPLFNNYIIPGHVWSSIVWVLDIVLLTYGLKNIELMISKFNINKKIILAGFLIFLAIATFQTYNRFNASRWVQYGRSMDAGTQILFDIEDWMLTNTDKDDVFLANDESSFALNALSGRKLVTVRRTHASYYVDLNKRYADALVMLYGNNKEETLELLEQYSVDYVYVDSFLISRPMITSLEHERYFIDNNVNYTIQDVRLDPSTTEAPTFRSIVVPPQELKILNYNITTMVKQFVLGGQMHSAFYKISG